MDEKFAKKLVQDTLPQPFNKEQFIGFIKELLNEIDESKAFYARGYVPEIFQNYIKTYERIGTYIDSRNKKIDILIVYLQQETTLARARTAQRNFIARYLSDRGRKDAGLIAFVSPDSSDWRFSFVKMEYTLLKTPKGDVKPREELTPAKRYSFLVGKNENSHTAQKQLLPILQDDQNNPSFSQIENIFNIEVVTKEFFGKYRELFLKIKEEVENIIEKDETVKKDFAAKEVSAVDFSKKLLGQVVFLYFLQKKGWFGVERGKEWGSGSKHFLRELFEKKHSNYQNFFNDILEPLFYEALRQDRSYDDDYYSKFDCRIPFLNGGLFDPINHYDWVNTDILLPDRVFSNKDKTKEGDTGDGILDVFDRYNFTVKEDEPLEKEVAVDPEMLGKVFENLLEVKDRKSKGTYYTPREIVHYMCQESLINYLTTELSSSVIASDISPSPLVGEGKGEGGSVIASEAKQSPVPTKEDITTFIKYGETTIENEPVAIEKQKNIEAGKQKTTNIKAKLPQSIIDNALLIDNALKNIRVCDPAVGSGAFPVGMMNEVIRARNTLTPYVFPSPLMGEGRSEGEKATKRTSYHFKRHAIQNCLYGVDIDPGAVEIAKLRLWLSLIVDEEDIKRIKPLPNLDYKIMQGNSLIEDFYGISLDLDKKEEDKDLFGGDNKLDHLIDDLHQRQNALFNAMPLDKDQRKEEVENAIVGIFHYELTQQKADYFKELEEIKENARRLPKAEDQKQYCTVEKTKLDKRHNFDFEAVENDLREMTHGNKTRPFFPWNLYFADVFRKKGGFDVVIANPPYVGEKGHKEIFKEVKNGHLKKFYLGKMDYFYFFFHLSLNIAKQNSNISFITTNYYPTAMGAKKLRQDFKERAIIRNLMNFNELKIFESALGQHNMITILQKGQKKDAVGQTCITQRQGFATPELLQQILNGKDTETQYCKIVQKDLYDGDEFYIRIAGTSKTSDNPVQRILDKVKTQGISLGIICNVNNGIFAGADTLNESKKEKHKINNANVGEGIFILTRKEINRLNLNTNEKLIIKPLFKNSDISQYFTNNKNNLFIINLRYTDRPNINNFPNIKNHLLKFKSLLSDRPRTGTLESAFSKGYWYVMSTSRRVNMESEKIVAPQRSPRNTFGYNEIPWYASADVYFITEKDKTITLKYTLALLNSKLYYLWLYFKGKRKGEMLELYQKPLSEIPIKIIPESQQKPFVNVVDKILTLTKDDDYQQSPTKQAKVKECEHQIDQMVYKLYGLTEEEIKIVEDFKQ